MKYRLPRIIANDVKKIISLGEDNNVELPQRNPGSNLSDLERKIISSLFSQIKQVDSHVEEYIRGFLEPQQMSESVDEQLSDFVQMILYAGRENRTLPDRIPLLTDRVALKYCSLAEDKPLQLEIGTIAEEYLIQYVQAVEEATQGREHEFPILFRFERDNFEHALAAVNLLGLYGVMSTASKRISEKNQAMAGRYRAGFDVYYNSESTSCRQYIASSVHIADEDLFTIGRDPESTIQIAGREISRHHCQIVRSESGFYLRDTSISGTKVIVDGKEQLLKNEGFEFREGITFYVEDVKIEFSLLEISY